MTVLKYLTAATEERDRKVETPEERSGEWVLVGLSSTARMLENVKTEPHVQPACRNLETLSHLVVREYLGGYPVRYVIHLENLASRSHAGSRRSQTPASQDEMATRTYEYVVGAALNCPGPALLAGS